MKNIQIVLLYVLFLGTLSVQAQNKWDARLVLNSLDCQNRQAVYTLELKSGSAEAWSLGDQNYRLFFDGDLMTVSSVRTLLPGNAYTAAKVDQNMKLFGQGQEDYSPLDNIDDHLGFLDFSIVQNEKSRQGASARIRPDRYLPVAEITMFVAQENLNSLAEKNALSLYFSREETAGKITKQYTVITEHDAANHTIATKPGKFIDLTYERSPDAQLALICNEIDRRDLLQNRVLNRMDIENLRKGSLEVFPNPAVHSLRYRIHGVDLGKSHEVLIFDQLNRLIQRIERMAGEEQHPILLDALPAGVYIISVQTSDVMLKSQFVKMRE